MQRAHQHQAPGWILRSVPTVPGKVVSCLVYSQGPEGQAPEGAKPRRGCPTACGGNTSDSSGYTLCLGHPAQHFPTLLCELVMRGPNSKSPACRQAGQGPGQLDAPGWWRLVTTTTSYPACYKVLRAPYKSFHLPCVSCCEKGQEAPLCRVASLSIPRFLGLLPLPQHQEKLLTQRHPQFLKVSPTQEMKQL